jgi:hypothetical protein
MLAIAFFASVIPRMGIEGYRASRQPFEKHLVKINEAFREYLGEDWDLKS